MSNTYEVAQCTRIVKLDFSIVFNISSLLHFTFRRIAFDEHKSKVNMLFLTICSRLHSYFNFSSEYVFARHYMHFTLFCGISKNLILNSQSTVNTDGYANANHTQRIFILIKYSAPQIHRIARSLSFPRHLSISISRLSCLEIVHTY